MGKLKEMPLLLIVAIPFLLLAWIWSSLPEIVPIHWNISGEIDGYGGKSHLILVPIILPLLTYLVLTFLPMIDPKKKVQTNSTKYQNLRLLLIGGMSLLSCVIIYTAQREVDGLISQPMIFVILGLVLIILGNYLPTVRQNYFIGIRTPWSLENEDNWTKTNKLGGKLFFACGVLVVLFSFLLKGPMLVSATTVIVVTSALVSIIYSYKIYRKTA